MGALRRQLCPGASGLAATSYRPACADSVAWSSRAWRLGPGGPSELLDSSRSPCLATALVGVSFASLGRDRLRDGSCHSTPRAPTLPHGPFEFDLCQWLCSLATLTALQLTRKPKK